MKNKTVTDIIAFKIKEKIINSEYSNYFPDEDDVLHVSRFIISNIIPIIFIIVIGCVFNNTLNTCYALLGFSLLRTVSGGRHIKNADKCFFVSVILLIVLSFVPELSTAILTTVKAITFIVVMIYAPYNIENNTVVEKKNHIYFKYLSMFFVVASFFIDNSAFVISALIQSLTLINFNLKGGECDE
ncbi:UNVERIFIED_CONTAM: accessory gene regulator B [Paenibacillus sp. PvR008]